MDIEEEKLSEESELDADALIDEETEEELDLSDEPSEDPEEDGSEFEMEALMDPYGESSFGSY